MSRVGALVLFLSLGACAGRAKTQAVEPVTVTALAAEFSPGDEGLLALSLRVRNPEAAPVKVGPLQLEVWMNNHWFAAATSAAPGNIEIAPGSEAELTFPLPVSFRREGSKPESVFITFGLRGTLQLLRGGDETQHAFKARQRLEVKNAPVFRTQDER